MSPLVKLVVYQFLIIFIDIFIKKTNNFQNIVKTENCYVKKNCHVKSYEQLQKFATAQKALFYFQLI